MMSSFDVLSPTLDLSSHYLLEASAGTGKTFSIENIILRLLVEGENPLSLEQILAVTFTRAAVADMKTRVRKNLRKILDCCRIRLQGKEIDDIPDFLQEIFSSEDALRRLKGRLEKAIASFDQACIYTIHAFCAKMLQDNILEGNSLADTKAGECDLSKECLAQIIKDYLRTELYHDVVNHVQLGIVIKEYGGFEKLVKKLSDATASIIPVISSPTYKKLFERFVDGMRAFKALMPVKGELLLQDFLAHAPHYKGICENKLVRPEILEAAKSFAFLFDKENLERDDFDFLIAQGGFWKATLKEKYKRSALPALHYPSFETEYQKHVGDVVCHASQPEAIFSVLAAGCQAMGQRILAKRDLLGFNTLLQAMLEACKNNAFAASVRARFKAVIIDEFQDTDPVQWEIFCRLFPPQKSDWGRLFLVGDPKQSIYSFRQADIYTYLKAADEMGLSRKRYLNRNFRSEPSLVYALNALFSSTFASNFITLPRCKGYLEYLPVSPGGRVADRQLNDGRGSVHSHLVEIKKYSVEAVDKEVFPFIAGEIRRLHAEGGVSLSSFAVLTADRYQASRLIDYLHLWNIPAVFQRAPSLADSKAVQAMRELLAALLNTRDESCLKMALGGSLIGWTHRQVHALKDAEEMEKVLNGFSRLRTVFQKEGLSRFVGELMESAWDSSLQTVEERLLSREGGRQLHQEWIQLADWLTESCGDGATFEELIDALTDLEAAGEEGSGQKVHAQEEKNAVQVLTIHSSKGLEFDVVFPVGLYKRADASGPFIPVPDGNGSYCLKAVKDEAEEYTDYLEEINAEKMRQLYVALTRARHRLYIPFIFAGKSPCLPRKASPIEIFTSSCLAGLKADGGPLQGTGAQGYATFEEKLRNLQNSVNLTVSHGREGPFPVIPLEPSKGISLVPPSSFEIPGSLHFLKSYTLLSQPSGHKPQAEVPAPNNFLAEERTPYTLPAGSETGILLHAMLEKISFAMARQVTSSDDLLSFVKTFTNASPFKGWETPFAQTVYAAVKTSLFEGVPPLAEISDAECYREMEFVFPVGKEYLFDGYLKGVIDLIFRYKGKYYLVDWKSNWLGPTREDYQQENLQRAMEENDYLLQARIYQEALRRYLRLVDADKFGGTAYVFVRALSQGRGVIVV